MIVTVGYEGGEVSSWSYPYPQTKDERPELTKRWKQLEAQGWEFRTERDGKFLNLNGCYNGEFYTGSGVDFSKRSDETNALFWFEWWTERDALVLK
mgnify:CR=1 FL=1